MTDLAKFPNAQRAVWTSGTPTIAPSGGAFLTGAQWKGWEGTLATAVLKGQQLRLFALNGGGTSAVGQWKALDGRGRLRSAVEGPDGALYLAVDADAGSILRVEPTDG
jgi:glucose/arabinose dehydrogenase